MEDEGEKKREEKKREKRERKKQDPTNFARHTTKKDRSNTSRGVYYPEQFNKHTKTALGTNVRGGLGMNPMVLTNTRHGRC